MGCTVTGLDGLQGALVHQTSDLAQDAVDVGSATAQERGHIQRGQRDAAREALQRDQAVCLDLFLAEFDQMAEGRDDAEAGLQEWTGQRVEHDVDPAPLGGGQDRWGKRGVAAAEDALGRDAVLAREAVSLLLRPGCRVEISVTPKCLASMMAAPAPILDHPFLTVDNPARIES